MRTIFMIIIAALLLSPGLSAHITASPQPAHPGDLVTVVTTIESDQPASAHVDLVLPEGYTLIAAQMSNGSCASFGCNGIAQPGTTLTLTATVQVASNAPAGPASISALVSDNLQRTTIESTTLDIRPLFRFYVPLTL